MAIGTRVAFAVPKNVHPRNGLARYLHMTQFNTLETYYNPNKWQQKEVPQGKICYEIGDQTEQTSTVAHRSRASFC